MMSQVMSVIKPDKKGVEYNEQAIIHPDLLNIAIFKLPMRNRAR